MGSTVSRIVVDHTGGPDVMRLLETGLEPLAADHVRVDMAAAGVNYLDIYQRSGQYPRPTPFTPGFEGAGTVVEVGASVDAPAVGDVVAFAMAPASYATVVDVPAWRAVVVPAGVEPATAAAVMLQGMTAHYLSETAGPLARDVTVLIHAGAGGVGHLLVQLARERGATVIATASTEEKRSFAADMGAAAVLDSTSLSADAVTDAAGGPVDIVYDGIGQATVDLDLEVLAVRGALVSFGAASGPLPPLDPDRLGVKSLVFTKTSLAHFVATPEEISRRAGDVLKAVADGALDVRIDSSFPLAAADEAHTRLESRQVRGKVLLSIDEYDGGDGA